MAILLRLPTATPADLLLGWFLGESEWGYCRQLWGNNLKLSLTLISPVESGCQQLRRSVIQNQGFLRAGP